MKFEYEAIDNDGRMIRSVIDAENFKDVLRQLADKHLYPMRVASQTSSASEIERLKKFRSKLRPTKAKPKQPTLVATREVIKEKYRIDWTYVMFSILILGVIVAAMAQDGSIHLQLPSPTVESHPHSER